jgi:AcrR family transcriptional regulator
MMQADKTDLDQFSEALWAQLAEQGWARLSLAEAAARAGMPADEAWQAGSKLSVILNRLRQMESEWLAALAADFADAGEASIQEKLLEGLMQRFEFLAPHRAQFDALHRASFTDPLLAASLGLQLYEALDTLLALCGDGAGSSGSERAGELRRRLRVKGLVGVCLRVRPVWQKDDSQSLERTLKKLDKSLGEARDWGVSLRILRPQPATGEADDAGTYR